MWWRAPLGAGGECSSHSGCSIIMLACFGPEGGSDYKQQQGAEREAASGNLPAVGDDVLFRHLLFEFGNLGAVFRTEVRRWGRWIVEEPACVRVRREQHQEAGDEDEIFHCGYWE